MKIVILESGSVSFGDLSWDPIEKLGDVTSYESTSAEELVSHIGDADGIFVNKCKITDGVMANCPNLKFVSITATGYDNVDLDAAKKHGIAVCNVPAYSTDAVAQHAISLLLALTNHVELYNSSVKDGDWYKSSTFTYMIEPLTLLSGKSIGIIGYGNIGKRVAEIAEALGMTVNIYSRDKKATMKSDVLTLHCPVTSENAGFINKNFLSQVKDGALLINTARGGLIDENALAEALNSGKLAGAALDCLIVEPPKEPNPLIGLKNCLITPHIAWLPKDTRQKLINISAENLESYINDRNLNRLV